MNSFICPFCNLSFGLNSYTITNIYLFGSLGKSFSAYDINAHFNSSSSSNFLSLQLLVCPSCREVTIMTSQVDLNGLSNSDVVYMPFHPKSLAKKYPDFVPKAIRENYEEAYAILHLSPKSSATLSIRCLQGMIRDFHKVKKDNLYQEIQAIQDKVSSSQWSAIDGIRSVGNIGAHMKEDINVIVDIDPIEAEQLIKLIEILIDSWYIRRHEEQELYKSIVAISESKKS